MKKISLIIWVICLPVFTLAQESDVKLLFQQGVDAYNNEHYELAVESFRQLPPLGYSSADLYYNLGNAYYRLEEYASAVWCYEKALILNPAHKDACFNLEFLNNEIFADADKVPPSFFMEIWTFINSMFSPSGWVVLFIIFQILLPALVLIFFFSASRRRRKLFFYLSVLAVFFYMLSMGVSSWAWYSMKNPSKVVVKNTSVPVRSEPGLGGTDIVVIEQAGTVEVLEHRDEWLKIELPDGTEGWILSDNVIDLGQELP